MAGKTKYYEAGQKLVLRPVVGLTENLPKADLEQITVEAILRHRRLRDVAEERFEKCQMPLTDDPDYETVGADRIDYISAMIDVHAQQTVLSTLLDVLGYIPSMPMESSCDTSN